MAYSNLSMENRITVFRQSIHNALSNVELSSRLAGRGYPEEKLLAGKELGDRAQEKYNKQVREYGESFNATECYSKEGLAVREEIRDFRTIARVVFQDDAGALQDLKLNKKLKRAFPAFMTQVQASLNNALSIPKNLEALTPYGYDETVLGEMKNRLELLPDLKETRDRERTEAQEATQERDDAIAQMDKYFVNLLTIAPIAVKDKPELMELLNVVVPS